MSDGNIDAAIHAFATIMDAEHGFYISYNPGRSITIDMRVDLDGHFVSERERRCSDTFRKAFKSAFEAYQSADKDDTALIQAYANSGEPLPAGTYHLPNSIEIEPADKEGR